MAQVTDTTSRREAPALLIVAHGETGGSETNAVLARVAGAVAARLPGMPVVHGVLNGAPSLEAAADAVRGRRVFVHPFFMSNGYFVGRALPDRLAKAGIQAPKILTPLGLLPRLVPLVMREFGNERPKAILVAGHGSPKDDRSRIATANFAEALGNALGVPPRTAFLDEPPFIKKVAHDLRDGEAVVSFFAGDGAHARDDVPNMLRDAGRSDVKVVGPVGSLNGVSDLIAAEVGAALTH